MHTISLKVLIKIVVIEHDFNINIKIVTVMYNFFST